MRFGQAKKLFFFYVHPKGENEKNQEIQIEAQTAA